MTIGQRIAQKRKELGLSQEALGEELSVSRQSVYKWESDNALPEIDKLITMSKLFGVTIGWLLGVEEPAQTENAEVPRETAPEAGEAELTEAQLKMVEEIVDRYLTAQQPRKKRRWPWAAGAAAALAVLAALAACAGICGPCAMITAICKPPSSPSTGICTTRSAASPTRWRKF